MPATLMTRPYLLLTATMLLWGSGFGSSKVIVDHLPHSVVATLRFGGGALALLVALRLSRSGSGDSDGDDGERARTARRDRLRAAGAGVLGVFVYNLLFFWGLSLAPAIDGSTIVPVMSPVLTTSVLLLAGRERASAARVAGLALGAAGAVIFFVGSGGEAGGGQARLAGDLLFLLSACCWAAFTLMGRRVLAGIEPLRATTYATLSGAALLAIYSAPSAAGVAWGEVPAYVWLNVVFVALGPTAVANLLYYRGIAAVGPASASTMMFLVPVVGTACSALFLGESFGTVQAAGAVVLLVGAVLATRAKPREPDQGSGPRHDALQDQRVTDR